MKSILLAPALAFVAVAAHADAGMQMPPAVATSGIAKDAFYLPADPETDILRGKQSVADQIAAVGQSQFLPNKRLIDNGVAVESGYVLRGQAAAKFIAVSVRQKNAWALAAYAENPVEAPKVEPQIATDISVETKGVPPSGAALDDVYSRMAAAYRTLDAELLKTVYTPDAIYISRARKAPIESAQNDFVPGVKRFMDMSKDNGTKLDLAFRLTDRKILGPSLAVDAGYVEFVVKPGDGKPERRTTAKFLTVLARQADGRWAFMADTASDTPAQVWAKGQGRVVGG